ncbi:MAG: hypothetical protein WDO17_01480 [Alphaproteobacteria bacterium]
MIKWRDIELPGFDRPLRPVGTKRRRIFAAFLEGLIAEVSRPRVKAADAPKPKPEATTFAEACAACRGHCCSKGGNDAYLDETAIAQAWARHSRLSKRALMRLYLDAIPKKAFADSCIFHAPNGCSLPRSLRAPVSEAYLCGPLMRLMKG